MAPRAAGDFNMAQRYELTAKDARILYAISFLLPATVSSGEWWWGWKVALLSLHPLVILFTGPSNIGFVLGMVWLRGRSFRAAAVAASLSVASMIYCGVIAPSSPGGGPIQFPGGWLGPGYYLWLLSGVMLLWSTIRALAASRRSVLLS